MMLWFYSVQTYLNKAIPQRRDVMQCPFSNNRFLLVWFGLVWSRFYQLFGLRVFCCVLFITENFREVLRFLLNK